MKSLKTFLLLAIIAFTAIQCAKDGAVGPQGSKGEQGEEGVAGNEGAKGDKGDKGDKGNEGNANVRLYRFKGVYDFAGTARQLFECPSTMDSTANSVWTVYIVHATDKLTYPLPGFGVNGSSSYRAYLDEQNYPHTRDTIATWGIYRNSGLGETYGEVRIFRIYANTITESGTQINNKAIYNGFTAAEVKQMNYQEFCNNFGIKE